MNSWFAEHWNQFFNHFFFFTITFLSRKSSLDFLSRGHIMSGNYYKRLAIAQRLNNMNFLRNKYPDIYLTQYFLIKLLLHFHNKYVQPFLQGSLRTSELEKTNNSFPFPKPGWVFKDYL